MLLRKLISYSLCLSLLFLTVACGGNSSNQVNQTSSTNMASVRNNNLPSGKYPIQQASYDDATGEYTLMVLNTPPGSPPVYKSAEIQMARLTDEAIANGADPYLEIESDQAVMYLTEDFKIEYVHNVTETQYSPQTGQQETVVVRRESNFWTPFAGALAGQAVGNLLFSPRYYVPPVYQPGTTLSGYGGYGDTYRGAVNNYTSRYNSPPPAVKNRRTLRTSGSVKKTPTSNSTNRTPSTTTNTNKSTGGGFGSSTLNNNQKNPSVRRSPSSSRGFGSGTKSPSRSRRR